MTIQSLTSLPTANASTPAATAAVAAGKAISRASPEPVPAKPAPPEVPDPVSVAQAVASINKKLEQSSQNLRFSTDEASGTLIVRVIDAQTEQVILQIPTEEALAISRSIDRLQGLLVKQKA